jgi:uncharacterized membrane protein YvbJ
MNYCPRCGSLIEENEKCHECGFKIKKEKLDTNIEVVTNRWSTNIMTVDNNKYKEEYKLPTNSRFNTWEI